MEKEIRSILKMSRGDFNVKWRLTNCCNFRCSYCIRKKHWQKMEQLKIDEELITKTIPEVVRIINERGTSTKIEFIGGEVSLLDLNYIFSELIKGCGRYLKSFRIVSNGSMNAKYYNNLISICKCAGIKLKYVFSWHGQFSELEKFIAKMKEIDGNPVCEMVSYDDNSEDVREFIKLCEENNLHYKVEKDVNDTKCENLVLKSDEKKTYAYKVVYTDGSEEFFRTERELVDKVGIYTQSFIDLKDFYCSRDYDYLLINKDMYEGYDGKNCKAKTPLSEFKVRKDFIKCPNGCSLCGSMSVSKDKDELLAWIKNSK